MKKILFFFWFFISAICDGQPLVNRIDFAKVIIAKVDSIERYGVTLKSVIVRRLLHNETTITHKFLIDTTNFRILKFEYLILNLLSSNDSILEISSFYVNNGQMTAIHFRKLRNGKELASRIFYLESLNGDVQKMEATDNYQYLKAEEIRNQAKDLWISGESIKDWLRRKNDG